MLKKYLVDMSSLVTIFKCLPHPFCRMIILSLFQLSRFDHSLFMQKKYLKFLILLIASAFVRGHYFVQHRFIKVLIEAFEEKCRNKSFLLTQSRKT